MWRDLLGVAAAFGYSGLYSLGVSLQAAEAGATGREFALRPALIATLVRAVTQVVPAIFVIQMIVPVMLAPYLAGEHWTTTPAGGLPLALALALVAAGVATLAHRPRSRPPSSDPGH